MKEANVYQEPAIDFELHPIILLDVSDVWDIQTVTVAASLDDLWTQVQFKLASGHMDVDEFLDNDFIVLTPDGHHDVTFAINSLDIKVGENTLRGERDRADHFA